MNGIIDFHSHILPGIDDGSQSVEESIALLRKEAEQGVTQVIATPHFYPRYDAPEQFLKRRSEAEAALREEMSKHSGLPQLFVGAEVFDIYEGEHVAAGYKSIAFRIKLQDLNTTLTDETIETQMANLRLALKKSIQDLSFRE